MTGTVCVCGVRYLLKAHTAQYRNWKSIICYKMKKLGMSEARSRVINTKRTILSSFTKEYRVFVTLSGIRLFL